MKLGAQTLLVPSGGRGEADARGGAGIKAGRLYVAEGWGAPGAYWKKPIPSR